MNGRGGGGRGPDGTASVTTALRWGLVAMCLTLIPAAAQADDRWTRAHGFRLPESSAGSNAGSASAQLAVAGSISRDAMTDQEAGGFSTETAPGWSFTVAPSLWMPRAKLDLTVGDFARSATLDFSQVVDDLRFGVSGHFEAARREWTVLLDVLYYKLEKEAPTETGVPTEIDFEEVFFELGGTYRLVTLAVGGSSRLSFEGLAGGRLMYVDAELSIGAERRLRTAAFVDPMLGGRIVYDVTDRISLWFRGDAAGFGISDAQSQLTYNLIAGLDWRFARNASVSAGWRYMRVDFRKGGGSSRFAADLSMNGPFLGIGIGF